MVFAPHCDDETLGCAGLIQQVIAAGGRAQAVILTNGDSFRTAVECQAHTLRVTPRDYIDFAHLRQQESLQALANLGIGSQDVRFLGYPDQGLQALWNTNWTPDHLYQSPATRCDHAPYAAIFHNHAAYCGQSILDDIKANLRMFHPTLITVTHPAEDHGDHAFAAAFVTRALQELQADPDEASWATQTRLEYYLIHRGDWPLPSARPSGTAACPLVPPMEMMHTDTRWTGLPLSPLQTRRKAQSIRLYSSQTSMMSHFLNAFARSTELYGDIGIGRLPRVPDYAIRVDGNTDDWQALPPCLLDPVRDNVLRDLQGSGDIRALYACRDSRYLYLRLDCRQPVTDRMRYTVHLRPFAKGGATTTESIVVSLHTARPGTITNEGIRLASRDRSLEAAIPWKRLNTFELASYGKSSSLLQTETPMTSLAISAETWAGVEVDKTGVRFLQVNE